MDHGSNSLRALDLLPCAAEGEVGESSVRVHPVARIFYLKIPLDRPLEVQQPDPLLRDGNLGVGAGGPVLHIRSRAWTISALFDRYRLLSGKEDQIKIKGMTAKKFNLSGYNYQLLQNFTFECLHLKAGLSTPFFFLPASLW